MGGHPASGDGTRPTDLSDLQDSGNPGDLRGRSHPPVQLLQAARGCQHAGQRMDVVHPLSQGEDGGGSTEGKPGAVKMARRVWRGESGDLPRGKAPGSYPTLSE